MEELLLWRWSTAVQISSAWLVALFFVVLARTSGRVVLVDWRNAWLANAAALAVTCVYWFVQPSVLLARELLLFVYVLGKTLFLGLLLQGAWECAGRGWPRAWRRRWPWAALGLSLALAVASPGIDVLGVTQASMIALAMLAGAALCLPERALGMGWLGVGMLLRGLLGAAEAGAYGWRTLAGDSPLPDALGVFLAAHSSFDTGAEWVITLGCVLAVAHRTLAELRQGHDELHEAHLELTRVAERDPLTGVYNRRMLPGLLAQTAAAGGQLLFFDLDRFKQVNDRLGHHVGDACLRRFATALQANFTDALGVVRYAGDEFLLLLPRAGSAPEARIEALRGQLSEAVDGVPPIAFSHGQVDLDTLADPQQAMHLADLAMYRDKSLRRYESPA